MYVWREKSSVIQADMHFTFDEVLSDKINIESEEHLCLYKKILLFNINPYPKFQHTISNLLNFLHKPSLTNREEGIKEKKMWKHFHPGNYVFIFFSGSNLLTLIR